MNNKLVYVIVLVVLGMLLMGVSENFLWLNPEFEKNKFSANCRINSLQNCAVIDTRRPGYCLRCIFDDGRDDPKRQPFILKNSKPGDDQNLKGKGGCELNTVDPGSDEGSEKNNCTPKSTCTGLISLGCIGTSNRLGCDNLKENAPNIGASRLTNYKNGGCLPGATKKENVYAYLKYEGPEWTADCQQKNYSKYRCVVPVSTLKEWAIQKKTINGLDMGDIDELPDTGFLYGNYYDSKEGDVFGC